MRRSRPNIDLVQPILLALFLLAQGAVANALWAGHFGPTSAGSGMCAKLQSSSGARPLFKARPAGPLPERSALADSQAALHVHQLRSARFPAPPEKLRRTPPPPDGTPARGPPFSS